MPLTFSSLWRAVIGASIAGFAAVAAAAAMLWPPAIALGDRFLALAGVSALAAVFAVASTSWHHFERPQRLAAFVLLVASGMSWYSARLWMHERQFDYLVASQQHALQLEATELSGDILNYLRERDRGAPPHPRPASWDADTAALLRYETETASRFEQRFGPQVRRTRDLLTLEGLRDRDLDAFVRDPAQRIPDSDHRRAARGARAPPRPPVVIARV